MAKNNIKYKVVIVLFFTALILPNIVLFFGLEQNLENNENRKYKSLPIFEISRPISSLGEFKNFYLENFGLKTTLVNSYIKFKSDVLKEDPIPNRVVSGKENWLFLGNQYNNVINNSFGNDPFTKKELELTIKYFEQLVNYLHAQNISFYLVVPPDKNRVYQEFLPYKLRQNETKIEVLKRELKDKISVEIIDLSMPLIENKSSQQLYFKTDTHWNYYGAYIGYCKILDEIAKNHNIKKNPIEQFIITSKEEEGVDLAKMINKKQKENFFTIKKDTPSPVELVSSSQNMLYFKNQTQHLKGLFYRDSFANALIPFLNESFGEIIYHSGYIVDKKEIEAFKPDIIVLEIIERNIDNFSKYKPFKN